MTVTEAVTVSFYTHVPSTSTKPRIPPDHPRLIRNPNADILALKEVGVDMHFINSIHYIGIGIILEISLDASFKTVLKTGSH